MAVTFDLLSQSRQNVALARLSIVMFLGVLAAANVEWIYKIRLARHIIRLYALANEPDVRSTATIDLDADVVGKFEVKDRNLFEFTAGKRGMEIFERELSVAANASDIQSLRNYPIEPRETPKDRVSWDGLPWHMDFWRRWHNGFVVGRPLDWDLQREVSLIPYDEWEKGPEHIARLIAEIEARHLASAMAERIELAPSGRLTLVPQLFPEDRHLGLLIDTVRDALDLATSGLRNELPEDAYQVRLLRQTFARYGNDPQRIEMDFERARVSLIEDIAADAIPASAPNRDLVQALSDAAGAIRDSDAEIARNRERLNRIRLGQVSPEVAARIAEAAEQVAEISEGVLRDDLLEDRFRLPGVRRDARVPDPVVPVGAADRNAALEAQAAQLRLYSRLAKVWLFLKAHDRDVALVGYLAGIVASIVTVVTVFG